MRKYERATKKHQKTKKPSVAQSKQFHAKNGKNVQKELLKATRNMDSMRFWLSFGQTLKPANADTELVSNFSVDQDQLT